MNILVSADANYVPPLMVMLKSLFENNKDFKIKVFFLHGGLEKSFLAKLEDFIVGYGNEFWPLYISKERAADFPLTMGPQFTIETYYRLFASEVLPAEVERVLYLDVDIIINKNISEFYNQDFEGKYLIAARTPISDGQYTVKSKLLLGMPLDSTYFNAGVILYNLNQIRKEFDNSLTFKFVNEKRSAIRLQDQDVLNALFWNHVKIVDGNKYNRYATFERKESFLDGLKYFFSNKELLKEIYIIHYVTKKKPWKIGYDGKFSKVFWQYASGIELENRVKTRFINFFCVMGSLFSLLNKEFRSNRMALYHTLLEISNDEIEFADLGYKSDANKTGLLGKLLEKENISGKKIAIYGTADWAEKFTNILNSCETSIPFYLDSNVSKKGQAFMEKEIRHPDQLYELSSQYDYILIASSAFRVIKKGLLKRGIKKERIITFKFMEKKK